MAKKKADGVNVSAAVKAYLADHKDEGPKDVAEAVSKQIGKVVSASYVSNIKSQSGGGKKKGKRGRGKGKSNNGDVASLVVTLKETVEALGGAEAAKKLIDVL